MGGQSEKSQTFAVPEWTAKYAFVKQTSIKQKDIFLIGMTGILSGQVRGWSFSMDSGIWTLLCSALIPTIGYVILTFCIAEMTSALPFSGGIYGFVRAFTTPICGFIVAVFEILLNTCYVSPTVYLLASIPAKYGAMSDSLILFNCFLIYALILSVLLLGGKLFWIFNTTFGCSLVLLVLIYIIGSATYADFETWGKGSHYDDIGIAELLKHIPPVSTAYLGIQFLPLTSRCAPVPKKDIPIVMVIVITVCIISLFGLLVTASSQYPGIDRVSYQPLPLTYGFSKIFNISYEAATWFNFPFLFAAAFAFIFCSGRQSSCMAKSGLIPEVFQQVVPFLDTPYISLLTFALMNFVLNIIIFYNEDVIKHCAIITSLSTMIVYVAALAGYIFFHQKYSSLERFFASPFGTTGAFLGIIIFTFCFISAAAFTDTQYVALTIVGAVAIVSAFYFIFFSGEHIFSEEEKEELFKAYLVNANMATKKRMQQKKKNSKVAPNSLSIRQSRQSIRFSATAMDAAVAVANVVNESKQNGVAGCQPSIAIQPSTHSSPEPISDVEKINDVSRSEPTLPVQDHSTSNHDQIVEQSHKDDAILQAKSFSEKIIQFLSTKMNKISPAPEENTELQHLEILQAGGSFYDASTSTDPPKQEIDEIV